MQIDIKGAIDSAVALNIARAHLEDTPAVRIEILKRMHEEFANTPFSADTNEFLTAIENEVARLEGMK